MLWFFDLDNTLHNASHAIFPAITANMNAFVEKTLAANGDPSDPATVNAVRTEYWKRYGATLLGMVKHHDVCANDFLHASHQFDDLSMMIRAERGLNRLFRRLPGRKALLTNAPRKYSREIVLHLGLHRHFADHIPIEAMRVHGSLHPKPSRRLLRSLLAKKRIKPQQCILVEDTAQTLKVAKSLGMRTVLVTQYLSQQAGQREHLFPLSKPERRHRPAYVDVKVTSVRKLPYYLCKLRASRQNR